MRRMKYELRKSFRFEAAHKIEGLPPGHPCGRLHGHSYRAEVVLVAYTLDEVGMVLDARVTDIFKKTFDHHDLNEVMPKGSGQPTAENIARVVFEKLNDIIREVDAQAAVTVTSVTIWETESTSVTLTSEEVS